MLLLLMAAMQASGSNVQPLRWVLQLSPVRWVMFFLAFSGASLLWSATVSPAASALYWSAMAADVAVVLVLLRAGTAVEIAHSMMKGYISASVILAAIAWIIPLESDQRLGDLDYFNTNQIGNLCAMGVFMAQLLVARKDGRWRGTQVFLMLTLLRSLSKTTLVAFLVSQGVLFFRDQSITRGRKVKMTIAVLAVVAAFSGIISAYFNTYTSTGDQAETLTGRTGIWLYCLTEGIEKPWIGNGIDSLWKVAPPFGPELFEARHAENELLQQFFTYGLAGVAMLACVYGTLYRSIRKLPRSATRAVLGALLIYILIRGLAEAEPFDLLLPLWSITLITAYVGLLARADSTRTYAGIAQCQEAEI
jgi:O-antigen ligase